MLAYGVFKLMHFLQWFKSYPKWDTIGWLAIIGVGTYFELEGVAQGRLTTFTDLVRHTIPVWVRAAVLGLLAYHFILDPVNFK